MPNAFFYKLIDMVTHIKITDMIDILLVAFALYKIYGIIKETRAEQLVKGILVLLGTLMFSEVFNLYTVNWILRNTMTVGLVAILVVFQPELRRILENLGRTKFLTRSGNMGIIQRLDEGLKEVTDAAEYLSCQKIGALIVFEKDTGLGEVIQTGEDLDAIISKGLIVNVFYPNTPLHDGAMVIRNAKITAAGCFLPLTENKSLSKELGTRHRAAIGISEKSDAIVAVVSEETGAISVALSGKLYRNLDTKKLYKMLRDYLIVERENVSPISKNIFGNSNNKDAKIFEEDTRNDIDKGDNNG